MRRIVLAFMGLLACTSAFAADAPKYEDLVTRLKSGDTTVDYTELRLAYAQSDAYDPYDVAIRDKYEDLIASVHDRDCPAVLTKSQALLEVSYLSIFTHLFRAECLEKTGDLAGSNRELDIAHGLDGSLKASGDGKTPETAFVVVTLSEEHYLLVALGFQEEQQALINKNGHVYDLITGHDEKGGEHSAYFDVGALFAGMQKRLDKGQGAP